MASKDQEKLLVCSFCGKNQTEVRKLIAGPSVFICNECVDLCNDIINEETKQNDDLDHNENKDKPLLTPKEIYQKLDEHVIGQDEAKKSLYICVCDKSNSYFIGPPATHYTPGSGKMKKFC